MSLGALLGPNQDSLLSHQCTSVPSRNIHVPGPDFVERVFGSTDRNPESWVLWSACLDTDAWGEPDI